MDIYLVFGFISEDGSDEGHTYIYGVFDNRVVAEEKKNKLEEALERDGSDTGWYHWRLAPDWQGHEKRGSHHGHQADGLAVWADFLLHLPEAPV